MNLKTIKEIKDLKGKKTLVRVDFNVPLVFKNNKVKIVDDTRLEMALPTIKYLIEQKARIILISHLGRPTKKDIEKLSLEPIAKRLSKLIGKKVDFINDSMGYAVEQKINKMKNSQIVLLENLRFYNEEDDNDKEYAKKLASLGQVYINDAFAFCHRPTASIIGIPKFLPSYAGFLVEKEIEVLEKLLKNPKKPFIALIGGVKIKTKEKVINSLLKKCNYVLLGGALANTFLKAKGLPIGKSVYEKKEISRAKKLLKNKKIVLPVDVAISRKKVFKKDVALAVAIDEIQKNDIIYDIGPETIKLYSKIISKANTIVWNGPMGFFEKAEFSHGSIALARTIAKISKGKIFGVVGGGETLAVLEKSGMQDNIDHISSGGGAMLEFLEGKILPGIKPLIKK